MIKRNETWIAVVAITLTILGGMFGIVKWGFLGEVNTNISQLENRITEKHIKEIEGIRLLIEDKMDGVDVLKQTTEKLIIKVDELDDKVNRLESNSR